MSKRGVTGISHARVVEIKTEEIFFRKASQKAKVQCEADVSCWFSNIIRIREKRDNWEILFSYFVDLCRNSSHYFP